MRPLLVSIVLGIAAAALAAPKPAPGKPAPAAVQGLFAGGQSTCVLESGQLVCWGSARHGALGAGVTSESTTVPTALTGLTAPVEVAFGQEHGCARLASGSVSCWGANEYGQLGSGGAADDVRTPATVAGVVGATQVAAGGYQSCALAGGKVLCWGDGHGKTPTDVGLAGAVQLAVGEHHVCARTRTGVSCWGANDHGQLGVAKPAKRPAPAAVAGLGAVDELAAAGDFTCARKGGTVRCWGAGDAAQLGDVARKDSPAPRLVAGLDDAVELGLGIEHACARRSGGTVVCWGGPDHESFGFPAGCPKNRISERRGDNGMEIMIMNFCAAPVAVPGLANAVRLVHGIGHACVLDKAGEIRCWGGMGSGELGNREHGAAGSHTPVAVTFAAPTAATSTRAIAVAAQGHWSCAVITDGTVRCWGASPFGELGPGSGDSVRPVTIPGLTGVREVALGVNHACALQGGGGVRCWGINVGGELGDGTIERRLGLVTPLGVPAVVSLATPWSQGSSHTCALTKQGEVWCWGGAVHYGDKAAPPPAKVPGITGATSLALSSQGNCAVVKGEARCWGNVPATQGSKLSDKPSALAGLDKVAELGMGETVACARKQDGSVWCWGNWGKKDGKPAPLALGGPARTLLASGYRGLAVLADGTVKMWWLELTEPPTAVTGLSAPLRLASSSDHFCGIDHDGHVLCWGDNMTGQLGNPDQGVGGNNQTPGRVPL